MEFSTAMLMNGMSPVEWQWVDSIAIRSSSHNGSPGSNGNSGDDDDGNESKDSTDGDGDNRMDWRPLVAAMVPQDDEWTIYSDEENDTDADAAAVRTIMRMRYLKEASSYTVLGPWRLAATLTTRHARYMLVEIHSGLVVWAAFRHMMTSLDAAAQWATAMTARAGAVYIIAAALACNPCLEQDLNPGLLALNCLRLAMHKQNPNPCSCTQCSLSQRTRKSWQICG